MSKIQTYREFWPFYLAEHSRRATRIFHFIGTSFGLVCLGVGVVTAEYHWLMIGLFVAYGLAWASHFFIEKNRPATFKYPLWSFVSDFRMFWWMLCGKLWR